MNGRENEVEIIEKANYFAKNLVALVMRSDLMVKIINRNIDDNKRMEIIHETLLFHLHLSDRIAFDLMDADKRDIFVDNLVSKCIEILSGLQFYVSIKDFEDWFLNEYMKRQEQYSKYKYQLPKKPPFNGTLFWEFGKNIVEITGLEKDIIIMFKIIAAITSQAGALNLRGILSEK